METKNFKFIEGSVAPGEEARIRFCDQVDYWSVSSFTDEFTWLEEYVKPSKIKILINSEGGSVIRGMSAVAVISNSTIPTETVIEGMAASMGSVIWCMGDVCKTKDYGLLMIHNPYNPSAKKGDTKDPLIEAMTTQIRTIYMKRWGKTEEEIKNLMDGPEGQDGTFMDAAKMLELGILSEENIIKTSKAEKEKIAASLKASMSILGKVNKPYSNKNSTINKTVENSKNSKNFKNMDLKTIAANLSLGSEASEAEVITKINALKEADARAKALKIEKDQLEVKIKASNTSVDNLKASLESQKKELDTAKAELQTFKDEAQAKKDEEITSFIEDAVKNGKIKPDARETWINLAKTDFDSVKSAIDNIVAVPVISETLAKTQANTREAKANMTKEELTIEDVAGDIEFKTLEQ